MDDSTANPLFIILLGILRCLVPLLIMFGISYLLKRFGLIKESPIASDELDLEEDDESNPIEGEQANE
jgi:hypothetical protein